MSAAADLMMGAIARELEVIFSGLESDAVAMLQAEGRDDTGSVRGSIYSTPAERKGNELHIRIGAASDHAMVVHEGRGPNKRMPPIRVIQPWVERKLGVPAPASRGVAFAIARKIAREGTKTGSARGETGGRGTPFLRVPFEAKLPTMPARLSSVAVRALNSVTP